MFQAVVLGPSSVPRAVEPVTPELALLSALAHGASDPDALRLAVTSIARLGEDPGAAYFDLLRYHLGAALDRALEAIMATSERPYLSDFANSYYDKGKAAGEAAHARAALLTVIGARTIPLGDGERARIDACTDVGMLDAWLGRAARAATMAEVFRE